MKDDEKKAIEELLNSELEQIEGGACQCDTGAGQIVFTVPDKTKMTVLGKPKRVH